VRVPQLFQEFALIPDISIVVTLLPKYAVVSALVIQALRVGQLEVVDRVCEQALSWLAQEKMHVVRHDHEGVDTQIELSAHAFQNLDKQVAAIRGTQTRAAMIASERDEVGLSRMLEALESAWHGKTVETFLTGCSDSGRFSGEKKSEESPKGEGLCRTQVSVQRTDANLGHQPMNYSLVVRQGQLAWTGSFASFRYQS
jgi:hypothetical protein